MIGTATQAARVVVVEARPLTRLGVTRAAELDGGLHVAAEGEDIAVAVALVATHRPDVAVLGHDAERGDGDQVLAVARDLRDAHPDLGIVVLAADADDEMLFGALDAGASAFVSLRADTAEVVSAVKHAAAAPRSFTSSGLAAALHRRRAAPESVLSPRERDVLRLLQAGNSVPEVAAELFITTSTAKTYVARLYDKLGASNRSQALMIAIERGLVGPARLTASLR